MRSGSASTDTIATLQRLAALNPTTLAIMHGSSVNGHAPRALAAFAEGLARQRLAPPG
jgi:hypothetical protein